MAPYIDRDLLREADELEMTASGAATAARVRRAREAATLAEAPAPPTAPKVDLGSLTRSLTSIWDDDKPETAPQPTRQQQASGFDFQGLLSSLSAPWSDPAPPKPAVPPGVASRSVPSGAATATPAAMPTVAAGQQGTAPQPMGDLRAYARAKAASLGIDPDIAERVAMSEGGFDDPARQSDVVYQGQREQSYGPYQLNVTGGLGAVAIQRGHDPRDPANVYRNIDFALEEAARGGWAPFHGAARVGIGERDGIGQAPAPRPGLPTPPQAEQTPAAQGQAFAAGEYTPNQINAATAEGLDYETALAVCGPAAAIAFARKTGRNPTMQEALGLAKQAGWTVESGMAGPASQQRLLQSMGVAARLQDGVPDWASVAADVHRGNPVIVSTPGHYFVAERYDPDTGAFDFGNSAAVLKAAKGRRWFRPEELASLGMGEARASLFMDSPESPSPSVVAGRTTAAPATGAAAPPPPSGTTAAGASPPAAVASPLDAARATYGDAGDAMQRASLGQPQDAPLPEAGWPGNGIPGLGTSELDKSGYGSEPLAERLLQPWRPPDGSIGLPGGDTLYRGPLGAHPELPPTADPTMGPGDGGYAPVSQIDNNVPDMSPDSGISHTSSVGPMMGPGDGGAAPTPEPLYGPPIEEAGPPTPEPEPSPPGLLPVWDETGARVTGYVRSAAEGIKRAATGLLDAAQEPQNAVDTIGAAAGAAGQAAWETANPSDPAAQIANTVKLPTQRGIEIVQAALDAGGEEVGRRVGRAAGLTDEEMFSAFGIPISAEDIAGFAGSVALDPTNLVSAAPVARAAAEAAPVVARAAGRGARAVAEEAAYQATFGPMSAARHVVPPDVARTLGGPVRVPDDRHFREAVEATEGARLSEDGLHIDVRRFQKPEQAGQPSARTGVYYTPSESLARAYENETDFGGPQAIRGETLIRNPLAVFGATGRLAPNHLERVIDGGIRSAVRAIRDIGAAAHDIHNLDGQGVVTGLRQSNPAAFERRLGDVLEQYGGDPSAASELIRRNPDPDALAIAAEEHVLAFNARKRGHDAVVVYDDDYSGGTRQPRVMEVFDLREATYPTPEGGYTLRPEFQPQTGGLRDAWQRGRETARALDAADDGTATLGVVGPSPGARQTQSMPPDPVQPVNTPSAMDVVEEIRRTGMTPPARVVEMIGERPDYLQPVAETILAQRRKVVDGTMTARDVAKAYYMTIASQGADAIKVATVEAKVPGFKIPEQFWSAERANDGSPLVRPEEAAAAWLFTPRGQAALDAIERGVYDPAAWADGAAVRRAFGDDRFRTTNVLGERAPVDGRTKFNMQTLQAFTDQFNDLAQRVARGEAPVQLLDRFTKRLNGVREAKAPFLMHALGFGDSPTIDAVEINTWLTGAGDISRLRTREAEFVRRVNEWLRDPRVGAAMRERITQQFDEVRQLLPPEATADLPPEVFNHVLHHWIWDRMKGISTTHEGFYNALNNAAVVGPSPGLRGAGIGTQLATDAGNAVLGGMAGATYSAATGDEENLGRNVAVGMAGFPLAGRAMRRGGGALAQVGPAGNRGGRPTVETLEEALEQTRNRIGAARQAGDHAAADRALDEVWQLESQLVDARNARLRAEPAISSDVGRQVNPLTYSDESADTLADAMRPRERVSAADAADLGGPASVPTQSISLNAGLGVVPESGAGRRWVPDARYQDGGFWWTPEARVPANIRDAERAARIANADYRGATRERVTAERLASRRPDDQEAQQAAMDAVAAEERAKNTLDAAREWLQVVQTGDTTFVSTGSAPSAPGSGALSAFNRAASEAIVGGTGGAVIEQGRNPDDPNAAARGFAAGALGFPVATRAARMAARAAGRGVDTGGGARIGLGDVPPSQIRQDELPGLGLPEPRPISEVLEEFPSIDTPALRRAITGAQRRKENMERRGLAAPSVWDWIKQAGYAGIYGPATFTNSVLGGAQELLLGSPKEAIRALVSGRPGNYGAQVKAQVQAMPEGLAGLGRVLLGSDSAATAAVSGGSQGTANLSERVVNPVGHFAARLLERPGEILTEAPDAVLRPMFLAQGMQREAGRLAAEVGLRGPRAQAYADELMKAAEELRTNPDAAVASDAAHKIVDAGKEYADRLSYKGDSGGLGRWLGQLSRRDDPIGVLAAFLTPFPGMVGRMSTAAAQSTPGIGLLPGVRRGQPTKFDVVYDQAFGTVLASSVAYWAFNGGVTGSGPSDPEKRKMMMDQGWQPNSYAVGGFYVPNRTAGRFQPMLDTAGELHDAITYAKKDYKPSDLVADLVKRGSKIATDQVGLSGMADFQDMMAQGFASQFPGWATRSGLRYVPYAGVMRGAANALDDKQRKPEGWGDEAIPTTAIGQHARMAVPGLRQTVPPAQTVLGQDAPNPQQGIGALAPRITTQRNDPVIRLFEQAGVDIGKPNDQMTVGRKTPVGLKPSEQRAWNTHRGQFITDYADAYLSNPDFMALPPKQKEPYLQKFLEKAADHADKMLQADMDPDDLTNRAIEGAAKKAS